MRSNHRPSVRRAFVAGCLGLLAAMQDVRAQPVIWQDRIGDAVMRRTDLGAGAPFDPLEHRLPDVIEMRLGAFMPGNPAVSLFAGAWVSGGGFMRFDVVLDGLINPPGPLAFADQWPQYDPYRHGPNPIYGWIEFDMDADEDTGGELSDLRRRYLGNVARFGGLPSESRFANRAARRDHDLDSSLSTPPFVERSGEEFHIAFLGERIDTIQVIVEGPDGDPEIFEAGETWILTGEFFHRAHAFEDFAFSCVSRPGKYEPVVSMRFEHDIPGDRTTISLVYPLTNTAAAMSQLPPGQVEPNDGCTDNQNSIEEALEDLHFSALFADPFDRLQPEFELIAGWEFNMVAAHLDPAAWRLCGLVGSAYAAKQPGYARFVWSDVWPDPRIGDVNGDGEVDALDLAEGIGFIAQHDGEPTFDTDGDSENGSITWQGYARGFSVLDTNYDGIADSSDAVILGDMDLSLVIDFDDVADFVVALLTPEEYSQNYDDTPAHARGDLNGDGLVDGADIALFIEVLLNP